MQELPVGLPKITISVAQQLTLHMKYTKFQKPAGLLTENFQVRDLGQILVVYGYWAPANDKGQSTLDNTKQ